MRAVDPFDYWENHSSVIEGLGGSERSPDPRYLFHTRYHEVRAGHARFVLRLSGMRATFGELSVRLHAWKPETNSEVSLVSGARALLDVEAGEDVTLPVHFAAQKGVLYALYGYLSEDSDITAQTLRVAIDEPEDTGEVSPEPPRSVMALSGPAEEARPANVLLHYGRVETGRPVSQSCTVDQVAALGFMKTGFLGRRREEDGDTAIALWSEATCLNALDIYGTTDAGLEGLVVGPCSPGYAHHLVQSASLIRLAEGAPPDRESGDFFDFLLMPNGPWSAHEALPDMQGRWEAIQGWLGRLKIGGLAILGLRYRPDRDLIGSASASNTQMLSRNEIGQWALRLIGGGFSVAPMAFASISDLVVDHHGLAGFILIVQRS